MQDEIFNLLMQKDDITWQTVITELIRSEKMNPWDIDISLLTKKYIEIVKMLQELDLNISGKVVLCAAILLKIKSTRLVGDDIDKLDMLFAGSEESDLLENEDIEDIYRKARDLFESGDLKLIPRTPQPRKRNVSIYDLMEALQKALEVKKRRVLRDLPDDIEMTIPKKKMDVSLVIREVFGKIKLWFFTNKQRLKFTKLMPEQPSREDKVYTFIPLLHLSNERRIDIFQEQSFGEIEIELLKQKVETEIKKELEGDKQNQEVQNKESSQVQSST